jgi:hypothetical protein
MLTIHYGAPIEAFVTAFALTDDFGNLVEWDRDLLGITWPHAEAWNSANEFRESGLEVL